MYDLDVLISRLSKLLFLSIMLFFPGCSSLETSFNIVTFQKADKSGIVAGQEFLVYPFGDTGFFRRADLAPLIQNYPDQEFQDALDRDCKPLPRPEAFTSLPTLITNAGGLLFQEIFNQIEAKGARIAKQSSPDPISAIVTWRGAWRNIRCLVMARLTDLDGDHEADEVGMLAIVQRLNVGPQGSILRPVYFHLNNAVALTGASDRPAVAVGMGFTVKSIKSSAIINSGELKLMNDVSAIIGMKTPVCVSTDDQIRPQQSCPMATELFVDPPNDATAFQLAVAVKELGTAAKINEGVTASNAALKSLIKPVFDEFLAAIANAAKNK